MLDDFLTNTLKFAPRQLNGFHRIGDVIKSIFTAGDAKKALAAVVALLEIFSLILFDTPTTPAGAELDLTGYSLVFEDEFEGEELNMDVWQHRGIGVRRGGFSTPGQVSVQDGNMIITGEYLEDGEYGAGWYGGMVKLKQRYCKGYFEIRCKCNAGTGFWSAFWIQADHPYEAEYSKGGVGGCEIDIFEAMSADQPGKFANAVTHTVHCAGVDGVQEGFQSYMLGSFYGNNIYSEYNTYGLKWTDEEYIFYINGVESGRTSFGNGVSEVMEDVLVSLELPEAEKLEGLDKETHKTQYVIDYVKIYQPVLTPVN